MLGLAFVLTLVPLKYTLVLARACVPAHYSLAHPPKPSRAWSAVVHHSDHPVLTARLLHALYLFLFCNLVMHSVSPVGSPPPLAPIQNLHTLSCPTPSRAAPHAVLASVLGLIFALALVPHEYILVLLSLARA